MRRLFSRFVSLPPLSTLILCTLLLSTFSFAAAPDRIAGAVSSSKMVQLAAGVSLKAQAKYDEGKVDSSFKLDYVTLLTVPSASQQRALNKLLAQQQDPHSPYYHQWLTPEQYADRFGLSQGDVNRITVWLKSQGFTVVRVARGRNAVTFSGNAGQIESALHTEIHRYNVDGELHVANATKPSIPAALAGIVTGFRGLSDFRMKPMGGGNRLNHDFYDSHFNTNFIAPGDVSTIYDVQPLYDAGYDGTGQTLAVAGQTDIYLADLTDFRSAFGLPAITGCSTNANGILTACNSTNLQYVLVGQDPGQPSPGDLGETDLDLEWTGAVAKNAQIIYVNGETAGGVIDAYYYAIDNNLAPVISLSYGICEWGEALNGAFASDEAEFQFANSEGITFLNSTGDTGAAGCDGFTNPNTTPPNLAVYGIQVNYPASSPEVTGVGGTALPYNDLRGAPFWGTSSGSDGGSALEYIPEQAWNDPFEFSAFCTANPSNSFCTSFGITDALSAQAALGLGGGGGGASKCVTLDVDGFCVQGFQQPAWQTVHISGNTGTTRFVPDVSLMASPNFPGYIFCTPLSELGGSGSTSSCANGITTAIETNNSIIGGTSVSTPVFAGIVTLLNQYLAGPGSPGLGNINPNLYTLARVHPSPFHVVISGNNQVYCEPGTPVGQLASLVCPVSGPTAGVIGFQATDTDPNQGYNEVTGLGSVDANALALAWAAGRTTSSMTFTALPGNVILGQTVTLTATLTPSSATGTVSFFVNGSSTALGSAVLNNVGVAALTTTSLPVGVDNIVAQYPGDGNNAPSSGTATVTVTAPTFSLTTPTTPAPTLAGVPTTSTFTVTPTSGATFSTNVTFACTGLPDATVGCQFAPTISAGDSAKQITVTFTTKGPNPAGVLRQKRADNRSPWIPLALPLAGIVMAGFAGRKLSKYSLVAGLCVALVMIGLLVACGSSSHPVSVAVGAGNPTSIYPNYAADSWPTQTATFTPTVTNDPANKGVTWSASVGTIDPNGVYTAPTIAVGLPGSATITATSVADPTKTGTATETLTPATVPTAVVGAPYSISVNVTEGPTSLPTSPIALTVN